MAAKRGVKTCAHDGCTTPKQRGRGQRYCAPHQEVHRKARNASRPYKPKVREPRLVVATERAPVPAEIRDAYSRAQPGSILRSKFPTVKALERHDWGERAA